MSLHFNECFHFRFASFWRRWNWTDKLEGNGAYMISLHYLCLLPLKSSASIWRNSCVYWIFVAADMTETLIDMKEPKFSECSKQIWSQDLSAVRLLPNPPQFQDGCNSHVQTVRLSQVDIKCLQISALLLCSLSYCVVVVDDDAGFYNSLMFKVELMLWV